MRTRKRRHLLNAAPPATPTKSLAETQAGRIERAPSDCRRCHRLAPARQVQASAFLSEDYDERRIGCVGQRPTTTRYPALWPLRTTRTKTIVGAALVIRGALYFKGGCTLPVRAALVACYNRYMAAIDGFREGPCESCGAARPKANPNALVLRGGTKAGRVRQSTWIPGGRRRHAGSSQILVATTTSAEHKLATGFFEFSAFCIPDWQADLGDRGLKNAMVFTVPRRFLEMCPGTFEKLFTEFAAAVPTVWGHAGVGVNLPPLDPEANEESENFWSRLILVRASTVGDPMRTSIRDLVDKIKTVDWLTALDADLVGRAGGADALMLPPDWFGKTPLAHGGLLVENGVGAGCWRPDRQGNPASAPAAYVLLNHALRPIVADKIGILQRGTIREHRAFTEDDRGERGIGCSASTCLTMNSNGYWVELHKTPKLPPSS